MNDTLGNKDTGFEPEPDDNSKQPRSIDTWLYLLMAWFVLLIVTVIFKIKLFLVALPILALGIFGYMVYLTWIVNKNTKTDE